MTDLMMRDLDQQAAALWLAIKSFDERLSPFAEPEELALPRYFALREAAKLHQQEKQQ